MTTAFEKLKAKLLEMFQLDQPDLDFGIYRVLHARADEITRFLERDLLPQVREAFGEYRSADKAELEKQIDDASEQARRLGFDPEQSPQVRELRERYNTSSVDIAALENEIYDDLYRFFRRYYQEGDFLSKRVYKAGVYAIPYEGEEVKLHWANKDQYYIKTSEYLRDYAFRLRSDNEKNPMRVHFRLVDAAEGEHGNLKPTNEDRVFVLAGPNFIVEEDGELVIRFEYRPATMNDWPVDTREGKLKPPAQKDLIENSVARILAIVDVSTAPWIEALREPHTKTDGETADYSRLEAHLRRYTARNTFDYFIHKDLGGFLRRELDFFIKNEVMHLDDIEDESAPRVEQYLSKIKVTRRIAHKIIDFLAQIEDFQKKLWVKKKFVVDTHYCITLDRIPEEFYPEIAANDAQREEWVRLFAIDELTESKKDLVNPNVAVYTAPVTVDFLISNNKLPIDTSLFSPEFTVRLISSIHELEIQMNGLLLHSENYHAIRILRRRFEGQLAGIYIDPPYNTGPSEIIYRNEYRDSSWLSLMHDRLSESLPFLRDNAAYSIAIDDYELAHLCELVDDIFSGFDRNMVVVNHHPQGGMSNNISRTHEYMLMLTPRGNDVLRGKRKSGEIEYRSFMLSGPGDNKSRTGRPNSFYAVLIDEAKNKLVGFEPPPRLEESYPTRKTDDGYVRRYPISPSGEEKVWCRSYESAVSGMAKNEIVLSESGTLKLAVDTTDKRFNLMSNWTDSRYNAGPHGTALVAEMLGDREAFPYPKSLHTVIDAVEAMTHSFDCPIVLDFFGGSGTTGHAVLELSRNDDCPRKYILAEMGQYFDVVTKPRILKAGYSSDWRAGKPVSRQGVGQLIKVIRLESYEDALNNLSTRRTETQQTFLDAPESYGADGLREDYLLRYMLDVETRSSQSLLNVKAFSDPTAYKLNVKRPGSDESRMVNVDLLETFNWLIGLTVQHIAAPQTLTAEFERDSEKRLQIKGRLKPDANGPWWFRTVTGTTPEGLKTLIIWRKLPYVIEKGAEGAEFDNLVLDAWFTRQNFSTQDFEFDLIYVNGDNNLANLRQLNDTWKVRLIEDDFHRLMFDTEGI